MKRFLSVLFTAAVCTVVLPVESASAMKWTKPSVELGLNNLTTPDYSSYSNDEHGFLELNNPKSIFININIIGSQTYLGRSRKFGLLTNFSLTMRDYVFDNNITVAKIDGALHPLPISSSYKKSKLSTVSLTIPVLFEYRISKNFFVGAGPYGEMVIGTHTKYKKPKVKQRGSHYVNMLHGGLTGRIGYNLFYVFGNYELTDLFKSGKAPSVRTYSVGLGFCIY